MADRTLSNGQITDAVTQSGVATLAIAPALALASDYQVAAHASGLSMQNAVAGQRHTATLSGTAATQAATQVLSLAPSQAARAMQETLNTRALVGELISLSAAIGRLQSRSLSKKPPGNFGLTAGLSTPHAKEDPGPDANADANADRNSVNALDIAPGDHSGNGPGTTVAEKKGNSMADQGAFGLAQRAVERLRSALKDLRRHVTEKAAVDLVQDASDALQELESALRTLEAQRSVPAGGTAPGVVIVGSGNIATPTRIVGASF